MIGWLFWRSMDLALTVRRLKQRATLPHLDAHARAAAERAAEHSAEIARWQSLFQGAARVAAHAERLRTRAEKAERDLEALAGEAASYAEQRDAAVKRAEAAEREAAEMRADALHDADAVGCAVGALRDAGIDDPDLLVNIAAGIRSLRSDRDAARAERDAMRAIAVLASKVIPERGCLYHRTDQCGPGTPSPCTVCDLRVALDAALTATPAPAETPAADQQARCDSCGWVGLESAVKWRDSEDICPECGKGGWTLGVAPCRPCKGIGYLPGADCPHDGCRDGLCSGEECFGAATPAPAPVDAGQDEAAGVGAYTSFAAKTRAIVCGREPGDNTPCLKPGGDLCLSCEGRETVQRHRSEVYEQAQTIDTLRASLAARDREVRDLTEKVATLDKLSDDLRHAALMTEEENDRLRRVEAAAVECLAAWRVDAPAVRVVRSFDALRAALAPSPDAKPDGAATAMDPLTCGPCREFGHTTPCVGCVDKAKPSASDTPARSGAEQK